MKSTAQYSTLQEPTSSEEVEEMSEKPYRQALGALQYAAINTRPDIQYAVNQLARYSINPGRAHWNGVKQIFQYLKGTIDYKLILGRSYDETFVGYSDADDMSTEGHRAILGYAFFLHESAIS